MSAQLSEPATSGVLTTRGRILAAATQRFAEAGFEGTSTRSIGAEAQANIATIAYHFGDKEGLYRAVLEATYEGMLELGVPTDLPADPAERVRALVSTAYAFGRARQAEVRLLLRHVIDHGSLPAEIRSRGTARLLARVDSLVAALGLPDLASRRLELMSINHLIARYVVSDLADIAALEGELAPEDAVSRHLGDVAVRLLLPGDDEDSAQGT